MRSRYFETKNLKVIETDKDNIYIQCIKGVPLRSTWAYGINGTFFNPRRPKSPDSCWCIAYNRGKPIGANAKWNFSSNVSVKRGTIIKYKSGNLVFKRINNSNEFDGEVDWAIGGVSLYPFFNTRYEFIGSDVLRPAFRSGMAFKGDKVFLIITKSACSLEVFRSWVLELGIDGAINLDGGGSTQMLYKNKGRHTSRGLNNMIGIKEV